MVQVTVRADELLLERVRVAARHHGRSLNGYIVDVLSAATDPSLNDDASERIRERLRAAGLLVEVAPVRGRPSSADVETARRRAGRGVPLSDLVSRGRR
jgi:hypothetical protein